MGNRHTFFRIPSNWLEQIRFRGTYTIIIGKSIPYFQILQFKKLQFIQIFLFQINFILYLVVFHGMCIRRLLALMV